MLEAHPVSFSKQVFTIGFDPEFEDHIGLVDNARNHTLLQTKLLELGHPDVADQVREGRGALDRPAPRRNCRAHGGSGACAGPSDARPRQARGHAATPVKEKLASVPFSKEDFKNDPLIQKALEIFKGQIVEVRA